MRRPGRLEILTIVLVALVIGCGVSLPASNPMRGWSLDAETTLRWLAFGERRAPGDSSTVVIALDEETYASPPFKGSPTLTWTGDIGRVVSAAIEGGARVVGFDVVFASSIEDSQIRFGDDTVGDKLRGFDRDYLRALAGGGRAGKIVIGETESRNESILPTVGQRLAVGGRANLRPLNVHTDIDDVVRRAPLMFSTHEGFIPSMALELATRALGIAPRIAVDGVNLSDERAHSGCGKYGSRSFCWRIQRHSVLFARRSQRVSRQGRQGFLSPPVFRQGGHRGIGHRQRGSDPDDQALRQSPSAPKERTLRFARAGQGSARPVDERGLFPGDGGRQSDPRRRLRELGPATTLAMSSAAGAVIGIGVLGLGAPVMLVGGAVAALIWIASTTLAFQHFIALPFFEPIVCAVATFAAAIALRLGVVDREKLFLRRAFGLYLSPSVIERLTSSGALPTLGGETREITLFFSDVVGFSTLSEGVSPQDIVSLMNAYLTSMGEAIEEAGGFVDKFVGDAIVAIFGAPIMSANHAAEAVTAALECQSRLEAFNREHAPPVRHRIGLNTGEALIGNIGSRRRFNYTAFGENVNLASRLEQANTSLGTSILAAESVAMATRDAFFWREIDTIRVRGRSAPVTVFEPLCRRGEETQTQTEKVQAYAEGLVAWRAREFRQAEIAFSRFPEDPPAALFRRRCRALVEDPPDNRWEPILTPPPK